VIHKKSPDISPKTFVLLYRGNVGIVGIVCNGFVNEKLYILGIVGNYSALTESVCFMVIALSIKNAC